VIGQGRRLFPAGAAWSDEAITFSRAILGDHRRRRSVLHDVAAGVTDAPATRNSAEVPTDAEARWVPRPGQDRDRITPCEPVEAGVPLDD